MAKKNSFISFYVVFKTFLSIFFYTVINSRAAIGTQVIHLKQFSTPMHLNDLKIK